MPVLPPDKTKKILSMIESILNKKNYEVILFGSQTTGQTNRYSDIDIAIKAEGPLNLADWQRIEDLFEESDFSEEFDILDYYRVTESFRKLIDSTGVRLK